MSENEQNEENREMIDDIVFELREHDHEMIPPYLCFDEEGGVMIGALADRIEAAWKRERAKVEADVLEVGGIVEAARTAEKSSAVGNAAAMREALDNSNGLLEELAAIGEWGEPAREQIAENNAALHAPAMISEEYAKPKLCKSCAHYMTDGCEICGCTDYKEREGEGDGR